MLKIEKEINESVPVNNTLTCVSCATNNDKVVYNIHVYNPLVNSVIPLCAECLKKIQTEIEFLEATGELD